jgi:hypothetical protein
MESTRAWEEGDMDYKKLITSITPKFLGGNLSSVETQTQRLTQIEIQLGKVREIIDYNDMKHMILFWKETADFRNEL